MEINNSYDLGRLCIPSIEIEPISDKVIEFLSFVFIHGSLNEDLSFPMVIFEYGTFYNIECEPSENVADYLTYNIVPKVDRPIVYKDFNHWLKRYQSRQVGLIGKMNKRKVFISSIEGDDAVTVCSIKNKDIFIDNEDFIHGINEGYFHHICLATEKLLRRDLLTCKVKAIITRQGFYQLDSNNNPIFKDCSNLNNFPKDWIIHN